MTEILPISALVPTRDMTPPFAEGNRAAVFRRTLESLAQQSVQPTEMIVADSSDGEETRSLCESEISNLKPPCSVLWETGSLFPVLS